MSSNVQAASDAVQILIQDHKEVKALFEKFEGLGDRATKSKKKIADEICNALTVHATVEEEIFYPAARDIKEGDDLVNEAIVEHASAKDLIAQIQEMTGDEELFDAKVKVLSEQIEHHVKEEESEMFPNAKKAKLDLDELGKQIIARKEELMSEMNA